MRAAVEGRDTLALMPTGSGKSLTYQLAAMLRPEPTLVLSPLIALMKDQVDKLPPRIAATATFVNSSLSSDETAARLAAVRDGSTRIVYAAPERLRQRHFVELLRSIGIGLVVVDEVHCVSMWGHDFRPDYLFIRRGLEALGRPALLGMTATATPETADDIGRALGRSLEVVHTSVMRPNLRYDVGEVSSAEDRIAILVERLHALHGSAIVYARSRRSTEELARVLRGHGFRAEHYHAGLEPVERTRVQDDFVAGRARVVVATTAFGMGIDKPDVRLVCLVNYPDSVEGYVQMVGRAGRDGEPSQTLLLASPSDATALRRFAVSDVPTASELRSVYRAIRGAGGAVDPDDLAPLVPERDARVLVGMLEQAGLLERSFDDGRRMRIELPPAPDDARERVEALLDRARLVAESRADRVIAFAESRACRHEQVATHFGEDFRGPCGTCDVCAPLTRGSASLSSPAPPLPDDVGGAIVEAVGSLTWPLGRNSLVATLRGSLKAPPSGRRSSAYRLLAAATDSDVRRWVRLLEHAGALVETTTPEGFRVLTLDPSVPPPPIWTSSDDDVDENLVALLRSWRLERSREDAVPAYVVLHDATLRELAAVRPQTTGELAAVKGLGPVKLERYGDDLLAVLAQA